jgi:hypothetical protein
MRGPWLGGSTKVEASSLITAHTLGSEPTVRNHKTANQGIEGSFYHLPAIRTQPPYRSTITN